MTVNDDPKAWKSLAELYHAYLTGSILALVTRRGSHAAAEVVFRMLRRQQEELFLPGLTKLGLTELPHAVACAQYHVLSNSLGGVGVVWIPESDAKSWIRYVPPRWIFDGTAICGIPSEVSRAQLRGWHSNSGVLLDNPRLGFVCTMQTSDAQPGLEGYYIEYDGDLNPGDRLRFAPGERPLGESVELPHPQWDPMRLAKAERNYSLAYIRSLLPELAAVLGPADASYIGRTAGRQVAMQFHRSVMSRLELMESDFAFRLARLLRGHGDDADVEACPGGHLVHLHGWRLFRGKTPAESTFEAWNGLWEGLAAMEGYRLEILSRIDYGDDRFTWRVRRIA